MPIKHECGICHEMVINRIQIPSSTGLWICYDCFSHWVEDYDPKEIVFKIIKWWRNNLYNEP